MNRFIIYQLFLFLILINFIKSENYDSSEDSNINYYTLCASSFILDNYQYDLTYFQDQLLEYHENYKNDTFFIEFCSSSNSNSNDNLEGGCKMSEGDDSVCLQTQSGSAKHLGFSSTLRVVSDGTAGLILNYIGDQCYSSSSSRFGIAGTGKHPVTSGSSKPPDMESSTSVDGDTYYYNTTVSIICDPIESAKIITASFNDQCQLSIIIKSHYVCGTYQEPSHGVFSFIEICVILLASILGLILFIGLVYCFRNRIKKYCCCCFASRPHHDYIPINQAPPIQNINLNDNINQNNNLVNNQNVNNQNINNNNIQNNNNSNNNSSKAIFYNHEILQGQTPSTKNSQCVICWENNINTVILNCGHAILCMNCTHRVKDCPICRQPLSKIVQVYHISPYDD
ncbi:hypothetical protein DLAC_02906 [Tieghemostelium lacteum]|uniref:Uncharacterized protein n=1 Tax=Tieghemostelium lacteum TaxID=361077 RepID=A0A152A3R4_TIELA|nr:hypothetical protein DLAC_02906 [Tieghemostelium lacteum]|eukprot:KYR00849.1 hypothetical protein DLAC_02906 [Tieghemostelium lacteum]